MKKVLPFLILIAILLGGFYYWQSINGQTPDANKSLAANPSTDGSLQDYYKTGQDLAKKDDSAQTTFLSVGDIMLSRDVATQIANHGKDANYPFRNIADQLATTDFNFGNLESPFSGKDSYNPKDGLLFNAPTWTFSGLTKNNFKVLNLANNHAFDQGLAGLTYTKKLLEDNSIIPLGTGQNLDEAWAGKVYTSNNIRIGFVGASFSSVNDGGKTLNDNVARIENTKRLIGSINDLKTRSDFIVVTMHAGVEYTRYPTQEQKDFAHAAIDAGADIVIGAHPHWIQTTETYKNKQIFYSLGNFVFDQGFSQDTKEGLTLKITLNKTDNNLQGNPVAATIKQIELIPVIIENYSTPRVATDTESQTILKKIGITTKVITP